MRPSHLEMVSIEFGLTRKYTWTVSNHWGYVMYTNPARGVAGKRPYYTDSLEGRGGCILARCGCKFNVQHEKSCRPRLPADSGGVQSYAAAAEWGEAP